MIYHRILGIAIEEYLFEPLLLINYNNQYYFNIVMIENYHNFHPL